MRAFLFCFQFAKLNSVIVDEQRRAEQMQFVQQYGIIKDKKDDDIVEAANLLPASKKR